MEESESKFKVPGLLPARKKKHSVPQVTHQNSTDVATKSSQDASKVELDKETDNGSVVPSTDSKAVKDSSEDELSEHVAEHKPASIGSEEELGSVQHNVNKESEPPSVAKPERSTQSKAHTQSLAHGNKSAQSFPPLPYTEPHWSASPTDPYFLSVIKNGTVIQEINISEKTFHVFGRLPCCDVSLEHPSLSRYHAVLQYHPQKEEKEITDQESTSTLFSTNPKEAGFYVYDLGSTHGTFINKSQINPQCYYRLRVGQMVKFGGSSRMFLLEHGTGSQEDIEADAEAEIKDILQKREAITKKQEEAEAAREKEAKERESMGAMWGMLMEDAPGEAMDEEYELDPEREAYYIDDPKKALRKFFDREGLELEYETGEEGPSRAKIYTCRIRLPIDTATGESLYAEASLQGKKKEAVLQCALNACRILDAHDILRQQSQRKKRKERDWEGNDYYDSDEDTFLDRTGSIEVKRRHRMKKAGVQQEALETYQSLQAKLRDNCKQISSIEKKLKKDQQANTQNEEDDLDVYMRNVSDHLDTSKRTELKQHLHALRKEEQRLTKLMSVAKPTQMPAKTNISDSVSDAHAEKNVTDFVTSPKAKLHKASSQRSKVELKTQTHTSPEGPKETLSKNISSSQPAPQLPLKTDDKVRRRVGPTLPPKLHKNVESKTTEDIKWQDSSDYSDWLPPQHQSGDGRTHLNEKYGY